MDDLTPADRFLGCLHTLKTSDVKTRFNARHGRIPGDVVKKEPPLMPYGVKVQPCQEYGKPYEPPSWQDDVGVSDLVKVSFRGKRGIALSSDDKENRSPNIDKPKRMMAETFRAPPTGKVNCVKYDSRYFLE